MMAAKTDYFAAAWHQLRFLWIKWERQTTDGTVTPRTAFRLFEQNFVTHLSHPFILFRRLVCAMYAADDSKRPLDTYEITPLLSRSNNHHHVIPRRW